MRTEANTTRAGHALPANPDQGESALTLAFKPAEQYSLPAPNAAYKRVPPANGKKSPTLCFEDRFVNHPHHHHLSCSHDIITKTPEECGTNCWTFKSEDSNLQPSGRAFTCPHPRCKDDILQSNKGFTTTGTIGYRDAQLSHVYGFNAPADRERIKEKQQQAVKGLAGRINIMVRIGSGKTRPGTMIKRSVSPDLGETQAQTLQQPQRRYALVDQVKREQENIKKYGAAAYKLLRQVNPGKDIQRTETGEIMMEGQIFDANQTAKAGREFNRLAIDGTETFKQNEKIWKKRTLQENLITLDLPVGETAEEQIAAARREGQVEEYLQEEPDEEFERLKAPFTRDELASMMLGKHAQREARKVRRQEKKLNGEGHIPKDLLVKRKRILTPSDGGDSREGSPVDVAQSSRPVQKTRKLRSTAVEENDGMSD